MDAPPFLYRRRTSDADHEPESCTVLSEFREAEFSVKGDDVITNISTIEFSSPVEPTIYSSFCVKNPVTGYEVDVMQNPPVWVWPKNNAVVEPGKLRLYGFRLLMEK